VTPFPPSKIGLTAAMSEALADGLDAVVVFADVERGVALRLAMRSTSLSAPTLQDIALFIVEQTIEATKKLSGSTSPALPHLDDARRSLQAALEARDGAPARPNVGRA
jgi:hypothetical protein